MADISNLHDHFGQLDLRKGRQETDGRVNQVPVTKLILETGNV